MTETEHTHQGRTFSSNNKVVCKDCQPVEERGGNECFCSCHVDTPLIGNCVNCSRYHK